MPLPNLYLCFRIETAARSLKDILCFVDWSCCWGTQRNKFRWGRSEHTVIQHSVLFEHINPLFLQFLCFLMIPLSLLWSLVKKCSWGQTSALCSSSLAEPTLEEGQCTWGDPLRISLFFLLCFCVLSVRIKYFSPDHEYQIKNTPHMCVSSFLSAIFNARLKACWSPLMLTLIWGII